MDTSNLTIVLFLNDEWISNQPRYGTTEDNLMNTLSPNNLNELWISGQIVCLRHYEDHNKLVFTLRNTAGRFCIEVCPANTVANLFRGDQVMVRGALFSQWSGKQDTTKIRASLVQPFSTGLEAKGDYLPTK